MVMVMVMSSKYNQCGSSHGNGGSAPSVSYCSNSACQPSRATRSDEAATNLGAASPPLSQEDKIYRVDPD
jgi:hypothetical protein